MPRFEPAFRLLIDRFVAELVVLARDVAREELKVARAERDAEAKAAKAAQPRVSPRLKRALERAEAERRRAAERRAAGLAARAARTTEKRPEDKARRALAGAQRGATGATPMIALPPPLFVHKRSRDGSIQRLERGGPESAPPPA